MTRRALLPLLLALTLPLAACGGSDDAPASTGSVAAEGAPDAQTATVVGNTDLQFVPNRVTAKPGTLRLTLKIEGGVPHDLSFSDQGLGDPIQQTTSSDTGTYVFDEAGTYDFVCTIHPGMAGEVVVS